MTDLMTDSARPHPNGGYRFAPGIPPYSAAVVADQGFEIVHVALRRHRPWRDGLAFAVAALQARGRPPQALCGVELRSSEPHSFAGFDAFNADYIDELDRLGLLLADRENPVARTNVAPVVHPPSDTCLAGFSYTTPVVPEDEGLEERAAASFVIAGAGDLVDQADLRAESIVAAGDRSTEAMGAKVDQVLDVMDERLAAIGTTWAAVTVVNVYAAIAIHPHLESRILHRVGPQAAAHGVNWLLSHPPIAGLSFEMDLRGVETELILDAPGPT